MLAHLPDAVARFRAAYAARAWGRAFTYLEQGSYRTVCAILLVSVLVELPLDAAIIPLLVRGEGERMTIHLLMLAGALSSLVYMLDVIAACERLAEAPEAWLRRHGIERSRAVRVSASPFDKPNTVLILKTGSCVRLNHMGVERGELFSIFLYLDKPQDLVQALSVH